MSNSSFVRRAPELAEEILAKTASLPKDLQSFTRQLLSKEASAEKDTLRLAPRVSLEDLRKLAAGNQVSLPKIASVNTDDFSLIADGLKKVAGHHEQAEAEDVLAAAVSILEKKAAHMNVGLPGMAKPQSALKRMFSRGAQMEHQVAEAEHAARLSKIEGTPQHSVARASEAMHEAEKAKAEAARRAPEVREKMIGAAPMTALAVGTPLAAAALLRDRRGREENVKIYK